MAPTDAKAHIAKIRHDKGLSDGSPSGHNVSDLESALTTLAEQLYQSSTRFLLELLQNADDNSYAPNVEPSVEFTYSNGFLRLDCNEIGFSARNVEALCRVGQSTKKNAGSARAYVGEKGIGFKSVFKAADVVWIHSGEYSFKFDKTKPLGMIAPIWDDFPAPVKPGFTSLYLQLCESYDQRGLVNELRSLDSRILIFLRRLRKITVTVSEPSSRTWTRSCSRSEIGKDIIRLMEDNKACDYIVKRHQVACMPPEPKRLGVHSSEIILGFPLTENNEPRRESQRAYAFLPIRDYGFEFLIQADFLLIASREDIDESPEWNRVLRNALSTAFVEDMNEFNKDLGLRFLWQRYLPTREPLQSFLKPFHLDLMEKLASQPMIFSQPGALACSKSLTYVPEKFTFNGAPMTLGSLGSRQHLSQSYHKSDFDYLEKLGVSKMSEQDFVFEISGMIRLAMSDFMAKPNHWHSHLAGILTGLPKYLFELILSLKLVPLSDGSWVAAKDRQILFPAQKAEFELPGGLELSVVHSAAAADPERRRFFKVLGVGDLETEPVVAHIAELHRKGLSTSVSCAALVSQIKFLCSAGWKNPNFQRFWFTSEHGQLLQGFQLYQDSSKPHSATKFFGSNRNKFCFIHKTYAASPAKMDQDSWTRWLEEKMEVATIPRLVQSTPDGGFKMSDDFEFIIKNFPSSELLLLLRDNWEEYSKFFDPDQREKCSKDDKIFRYLSATYAECAKLLKTRLGSIFVDCMEGKRTRLDKTFLPSRSLVVAAQKGMFFVEVPEADDSRWEVLEKLGVSIKADVSFYLRCLETLAGSDDRPRIFDVLDQIGIRCTDTEAVALTKKFFGKKNLVYIPSNRQQGYGHSWTSLCRCRWKGPTGLRSFDSLKGIYSGHRRLFCQVLGVQDATIHDLVTETKAFCIGDSLKDITSILHKMHKMLEDEPASIEIGSCKLPVSKNWKQDTGVVSGLESSSAASREWFIADTAPLRTNFAGIVPLLEVQVNDLAAMSQVLRKLGLKSRFLSKNAMSVPSTKGAVELNQELTTVMRKKVDFIIRLLPIEKKYRERRQVIIGQLRNLQVYTADEVVQQWCVRYKGNMVKGPPGHGRVAVVGEKGGLKIYLAAKREFEDVQTESAPMELVDELFQFCGMLANQPQHSEMCLHVALSQSNPAQISKFFSDKGIPEMSSLGFADVAENDTEDDEKSAKETKCFGFKSTGGKNSKDKASGLDGPKQKSRKFKCSSVAGAAVGILVFPIVGIGAGIGALFKKKKYFDSKNNGSRGVVPKSKEPKVHTSNTQQKEEIIFSNVWASLFPKMVSNAFRAELAVHQILTESLGINYNPNQHWLSHHRTNANFTKLHSSPSKSVDSTFKFADTNGAFTQLLSTSYFPSAEKWLQNPPQYHIDVKTVRGGLFSVAWAEFKKARDMSVMMQQMKGDVDCIPGVVYILAIYDGEEGEGKMTVVVDPWEAWHKDRVAIKAKGKLICEIA